MADGPAGHSIEMCISPGSKVPLSGAKALKYEIDPFDSLQILEKRTIRIIDVSSLMNGLEM